MIGLFGLIPDIYIYSGQEFSCKSDCWLKTFGKWNVAQISQEGQNKIYSGGQRHWNATHKGFKWKCKKITLVNFF